MGKFLIILGAIAIAASAAGAGAFAAKIRYSRSLECSGVPCPHFLARMQAIESVIGQKQNNSTYLALGDSMVELADLPEICGRKPINAGIGWATSATFSENAARLEKMAEPDFVVISLGTNDAIQGRTHLFKNEMRRILSSLSAPVILVPVPSGPMVPNSAQFNSILAKFATPMADPLSSVQVIGDGLHLTAHSYVEWKANIVTAAEKTACPSRRP